MYKMKKFLHIMMECSNLAIFDKQLYQSIKAQYNQAPLAGKYKLKM